MQKFVISSHVIFFLLICLSSYAGSGNSSNDSFNKAKRNLEQQVYFDHRTTIYCSAKFDNQGYIILPNGFTTIKYQSRTQKTEWEHVVPAETFGRTFSEWREGHPECIDRKGETFKGRRCAEKVNAEFRHMQADMYNLYPAIGAVNAMRSNYNYAMLPSEPSTFGSCGMKISTNKAEPPARARGQIARTYFYMQDAYPRYKMSRQQEQLMSAWDKMYSVDVWECTRAKRIEAVQKNANRFVKEPCVEQGMW